MNAFLPQGETGTVMSRNSDATVPSPRVSMFLDRLYAASVENRMPGNQVPTPYLYPITHAADSGLLHTKLSKCC